MAGSCACVSHAKPSAFLKDQLLIRSVLLLIDQKRWAWMTTLQSNHGHAREEIFFFFDWSSSMIQSSMKPQNYKPQKQTNRNSWRRLFIPPLHVCTFTLTATFPQPHFLLLCTQRQTHTHLTRTYVCFSATHPPPTLLACPGHQSASPPHCLCDREAVRASQSEALMLSRSDRATGGKRGKQTASNIALSFHLQLSVKPECWQSVKKYRHS